MRTNTKIILILSVLLLIPDLSHACATCFGDPSAPATEGMNWAIITLLGVTGGVLGGVIRTIVVIGMRTKKFNQQKKN
ncbi:MAG: hypothetical protein QF780_10865 [Candidatus Marinimicrobia bacterium]|nr:hypothetical protein [Candidatus Neomarinimicrobiota bacterium]